MYYKFDFCHPEPGLGWHTYFVESSSSATGLYTARHCAEGEGYPTLRLIRMQEITQKEYELG